VRGQGFAVATMNLDHAAKLTKEPMFRKAYAAQTHVTADGRPIVWLSRLAGRPAGLVTGSDLVEPLANLCAELGAPIAMLGSTPETLDAVAVRLKARYPKLKVSACLSPPMGFDPSGTRADALLKELTRSGFQVCLLALGAPKQETFAANALRALPSNGFVSVGAGLDFLAGTQRRAPRLMRNLALEWLWRLWSDPRRLLFRYASCFLILPTLTRDALSTRLSSSERKTQ
jgi:N-acetylglucosaminyldiphosphoundecaprenol N-acetyl-beta-D-mannosaminyltransferase